jgi:hypothetical protein
MRRDMIERREGEMTFKVRIHHDGMVSLEIWFQQKFHRFKAKFYTIVEESQRSSAALLLPRAEGYPL